MVEPAKRVLTVERLRSVLDYDPATGLFRWKIRTALRTKVGDVAGTPIKGGYIRIRVDGEKILAHRLAWFYVTGKWPKRLVDHINGETSDNRFVNLREATPVQSNFNRKSWGASRHKGVSWVADHGKWCAAIYYDKRRHHLGFFDSEDEAAKAYQVAAKEHQGEYARAA